jgi:hypothetical protein
MEEYLYYKITVMTSLMTKILMSEPLPSRTEEVQVMSRQKLKVADHTTLTAHMLKLGLTQWQDC